MELVTKEVIDLSNNDEPSIWSPRHEEIFIDLMEEEVIKGNRPTTTFSKSAWNRILVSLCAQTKKGYTDLQVRNKFNQLKQRQKDFKLLLQETGIGYNATTGQVTASEDVWDKLMRVHKFARRFKKKGCPFYEKLCAIFGDTTASVNDPSDDEEEDSELSKSSNKRRDLLDEDDGSTKNVSFQKHKKRSCSLDLSSALRQYTETSKRKIDLMERVVTSSAPTSHGDTSTGTHFHLLKESICALDAIEDIDDDSYAKAIDKFQHEVWSVLFWEMPEHRRKNWILNLK